MLDPGSGHRQIERFHQASDQRLELFLILELEREEPPRVLRLYRRGQLVRTIWMEDPRRRRPVRRKWLASKLLPGLADHYL